MKSTALLVAAAAMMFAPSAYAREQTIDMAVMITSSDIASTRDRTPVGHLKEIPIGLRAGWPIRLGQPIAAATGDAPRLGAAGRCGGSLATTQGHRSISRLTGRVGAGPGRRARRRCRLGATRRQDRRSGKRTVARRIRQRRSRCAHPAPLHRGRDSLSQLKKGAARTPGGPSSNSPDGKARPGRNSFLRLRPTLEGVDRSRSNKETPAAWNSRTAALNHRLTSGAHIEIWKSGAEEYFSWPTFQSTHAFWQANAAQRRTSIAGSLSWLRPCLGLAR